MMPESVRGGTLGTASNWRECRSVMSMVVKLLEMVSRRCYRIRRCLRAVD